MPSSCPSASISITDASWLSSNPPGIYCTTGTISIINSGNITFNGYEFVSESTSSTAISVVTSGNTTFNGYCPSSCSSGGTPQTLFYATAGGISFVNSGSGTFTGDVFAPYGQMNLTVSGGTDTGFIEASSVAFTNSGSTTVHRHRTHTLWRHNREAHRVARPVHVAQAQPQRAIPSGRRPPRPGAGR